MDAMALWASTFGRPFVKRECCFSAVALVLAALFPQTVLAQVEEPAQSGGFLEETSVQTGIVVEGEGAARLKDGERQKAEVLVSPEMVLDFPNGARLTARVRGRADAFDELEPGSPDQDTTSPATRRLRLSDNGDVELRELFFDYDIGPVFTRTGKQQVVWGQADGLKVLDVVNPQDFREFILDDFEQSRIPLWTFRSETTVGGVTAQLIWIPDQTYHDFPQSDADFAFTAGQFVPEPAPGVNVVTRSPDRPSRVLEDSDVGFRISGFIDGWDLTANYLYHYVDTPVLFQSLATTPGGPTVTVTPRFERSHLVGGSFSKAFGDVVVRGEVAFSTDRYYVADLQAESDGAVRTNEVSYVVGVDWYGLEDSLLSAQLFQSVLTEDSRGLVRDQVDTTVTLLARHEFSDSDLTAEVVWLTGLNRLDGLVRPRLSYQLRDDVDVWIGTDIFYGSADGLFGQFDDYDRVVLGLKWSM